jgi:hypothetical protein
VLPVINAVLPLRLIYYPGLQMGYAA